MSTGTPITSDLYWLSAAMLTLVDLSAIFCLARCIPAARFRQVRSSIALIAFMFWGGLWTALMVNEEIWNESYRYIFTDFERWAMPPLMAVLYGSLGYGMWRLSMRLRWHPIVTFSAFGALISLPDHAYAIFVKDLLSTPYMSDVSKTAAFVFGIFEFVFYWILILSIAIVVRSFLDWWADGRNNLFKPMLRY